MSEKTRDVPQLAIASCVHTLVIESACEFELILLRIKVYLFKVYFSHRK